MLTPATIALAMAALAAMGAAVPPLEDQTEDPALPRASARLQQYLRIDTTNPPGNENRAVAFFADIFEREGIPYETVEPEPGRGSIWARLTGGSAPGIILLHHTDVVPADSRFWKHGPLSGVHDEGYLYGRGALDTKGLGIMHLEAFLALARSGKPLSRDIIFLATADEEAGGLKGAGWLVRNRPDLLEGVGLLLNEGGSGRILGNRVAFSVEVTQKVPLWLRLNAVGPAGHGSSPSPRSAVTDLVEALERLRRNPFAPRMVPAVGDFFRSLAELEAGAADLADPERLIAAPERLAALHRTNPMLHALTRNTCAVTRLEASSKINVVAPAATAELDCRLLPDQSSTAAALENVTARRYPGSTVLPAVTAGFTDSHFFRDLGLVAYGFSPVVVPNSDQGGVHGNNERISVQNVERGWQTMLDLLQTIALEPGNRPASASGVQPTAGGQR